VAQAARRLGLAAAIAVALACVWASPAGAATSAADRAATHAYLQARYEYVDATLAAERAGGASFGAFASTLEHECAKVLAGEPEGFGLSPLGSGNPRAAGESARRRRQRLAIQVELDRAEFAAAEPGAKAAAAAFATAVAPLRWSDPRVAAAVATERAEAGEALPSPNAPEVCADLRAWAQSGFRKLSPRTRELQAKLEAEREVPGEGPSVEELLRRYEGPAELALIKQTERLVEQSVAATYAPLTRVVRHLRAALGIKEPAAIAHPPTILGRGKTSSGATFSVSKESSSQSMQAGCRLEVSVEYTVKHTGPEGQSVLGSSGSSFCVAGRAAARRPQLGCEAGLETITLAVDPRVRSVRLRLADGRSMTSRVIEIPAKHGGPAALYVQALDRRSSRPLSLTELDAGGGVVQMLDVHGVRHCPASVLAEPQFVALVHARTPAGTSFTIEGVKPPAPVAGGFSLDLNSGPFNSLGRGEETIGGSPIEKTYAVELGEECPPREWAVVYGLLKRPGASVTAVTAAGEVALATVAIPARLHAGGVLAYGAFAQIPLRLIIRDAAGRVLGTEDLSSHASEHREYCEGYAEP